MGVYPIGLKTARPRWIRQRTHSCCKWPRINQACESWCPCSGNIHAVCSLLTCSWAWRWTYSCTFSRILKKNPSLALGPCYCCRWSRQLRLLVTFCQNVRCRWLPWDRHKGIDGFALLLGECSSIGVVYKARGGFRRIYCQCGRKAIRCIWGRVDCEIYQGIRNFLFIRQEADSSPKIFCNEGRSVLTLGVVWSECLPLRVYVSRRLTNF